MGENATETDEQDAIREDRAPIRPKPRSPATPVVASAAGCAEVETGALNAYGVSDTVQVEPPKG